MSDSTPTFDHAALQHVFTKPSLVAPTDMSRHKHLYVAFSHETLHSSIVAFVENEDASMTIVGLECLPAMQKSDGRMHLLYYMSHLLKLPLSADCLIHVAVDCSYGTAGAVTAEIVNKVFSYPKMFASAKFMNLHTTHLSVEKLQVHLKHALLHFAAEPICGGSSMDEQKQKLLEQMMAFRTIPAKEDDFNRYKRAYASLPKPNTVRDESLVFTLLLGMQMKELPAHLLAANCDASSPQLLLPPAPAAPCAPVGAEAVNEAQ